MENTGLSSFRLLTEYHSFLYLMSCAEYLNEFDYFRLLAEYYSFLFLASGNKESAKVYEEFPSPCGVLFILIIIQLMELWEGENDFLSPCGVSFILIELKKE